MVLPRPLPMAAEAPAVAPRPSAPLAATPGAAHADDVGRALAEARDQRLAEARRFARPASVASIAPKLLAGRGDPRPLPMTAAEMRERGWAEADVVFVTGDAYVDHPSFAMALIGRVLEALGLRVAILAQPDWRSVEPWRALGRPRLFYAVSAGNMDSMINHYTANKKPRSDDAYSPGGRAGLRPDRANAVYAQRCREAYRGVPVVCGGVEASLRRFAHYDYWSDTVKPSSLATSKCDLVVYGMGERAAIEIAERLQAGEPIASCRGIRGTAWLLGKKEPRPEGFEEIPSFEAVGADRLAFAHATRAIHQETNPQNAGGLLQAHGDRVVCQAPPAFPLSEEEMDALYELPFTRRPHPSYEEPIPADKMIRDSVSIMRGCFGGCTFCSITLHQGRVVQSRSRASVLREVERMRADPDFKGTISDLGGPTANMYQMRCSRPEVEARCRRLSCVHPSICKLLGTDHGPLIELMRSVREQRGVKRVHISSGIRMDLARLDPTYIDELARYHVGGHLKVAPEHVDHATLDLMKKPGREEFTGFAEEFQRASARAGKEQYLVPYFIASHPGSTVHAMIELAVFLKQQGYRPRQVQDFIPAPMDIATCMYFTGLDPMTLREVPVARAAHDRKAQRALMQFFQPENWFTVRKALLEAGRGDLIGDHCSALIPASPPREALEARRREADEAVARRERRGGGADDAVDAGPSATPESANRSVGYRPHRGGFRKDGRKGSP